MSLVAQYKTQPMECWPKLREIREKYTQQMWTAHERGELLVMGTAGIHSLPAGLGQFHFFGGLGPNFGRIAEDLPLLVRCIESAEQMGYGADTCSTLRATLGAMNLGLFDISPSGQRLKPDFLLEVQNCQAQGKTAQLWNENYGIPYFYVEMPPTMGQADYLIGQMEDAIAGMARVTGRQYQDELLIEAAKNEWNNRALWGRICLLQRVIPAPLDQGLLFGLRTLVWRGGRQRKETVEFYRLALDELHYRVENQIAALSTERCRLLHEGVGTWYRSPIFTYPKKYGAVYIGGMSYYDEAVWRIQPDGSWQIGPTFEELGIELKNRQDALMLLAKLYLEYGPGPMCINILDNRVRMKSKVAQDWHADGVVMSNDVGCRGNTVGNMEAALALKKKGIPYMIYEGSTANPEAFNLAEYMARLDTLLESLGLRPLATQVPSEQR